MLLVTHSLPCYTHCIARFCVCSCPLLCVLMLPCRRSGVSTIADGSQGLPSSTGSDLALALDMGCYELLPPAQTASLGGHSNPTSPTSPGSNSSSRKAHTFVQL